MAMLLPLLPMLPMVMLLLLKVLPLLCAVMVPLPLLALQLHMAMLLVGAMLPTLLELFMLLREKPRLMLMLCTGPMDTVVLDMVDTALLDTEVLDTLTVSILGPMVLAMDILTMDKLESPRNTILKKKRFSFKKFEMLYPFFYPKSFF